MIAKTISYTDYNGTNREDVFYFNLTEAELTEMNLEEGGGLQEKLKAIVEAKSVPAIARYFKEIILSSYGEKSPDGIHFMKSPEIRNAFACTEAYSNLYMELATNSKAAAEFIKGIIPAKLSETVRVEK